MRRRGDIVGAVDFGSRAIRVLIAQKEADGAIRILGHAAEPSRGCISQGVIQDATAAQAAFGKALATAEKDARQKVHSLFCAVNGKNVETFIREGNIKLEHDVVERAHMAEALSIASHEILAPGKSVTSSITSQEWYVDDLRVKEPIGVRGHVLKTRVHFARIPTVIEDNLIMCVESQGRVLEDFIFTPLASAQGCLTPEELELGVAVLDMGRGTTGIAVYRDYRILGSQSFDWGGYFLTRDVAACLRVKFEEADELIMSYGISRELIDAASQDGGGLASAAAPRGGGAAVKLKTSVHGVPAVVDRNDIESVIYDRAAELLTKIRQFLQSRNLAKHAVCGFVFTGGAGLIKNHLDLAASIFQTSCRIGLPEGIDNLPHELHGPEYCAVIGVVRHAFEYHAAARSGLINTNGRATSLLGRLWKAVKHYYVP